MRSCGFYEGSRLTFQKILLKGEITFCNFAPKNKNGKLGIVGAKENEKWKTFLSDVLNSRSRYVL